MSTLSVWFQGHIVNLILWFFTVVVGGFVFKFVYQALKTIVERGGTYLELKIANIESDKLEKEARKAILWVENMIPGTKNSLKLETAINKIKQWNPDWLMSDEKLADGIHSLIKIVKGELKRVGESPIKKSEEKK